MKEKKINYNYVSRSEEELLKLVIDCTSLAHTPYKQTVQGLTNTQSHLHAYYVTTTVRTENT